MNRDEYLTALYSLQGRVAVVTGGTGTLGSTMARALAQAGARVGIISRRRDRAEEVVASIRAERGEAWAVQADILNRESLVEARKELVKKGGAIHILLNAAGGNLSAATLSDKDDIFAMSENAFAQVVELNLMGTLLPSLVFGESIVQAGGGVIVNVTSMASMRALTRVAGYGAAKSAVASLTRSLATELGRRYGGAVRVNAIAPGFFVGNQNRTLLIEADGTLTKRGQTIVAHTPTGRFGSPDDLVGALVWLCGPSANFVNGIVLPVDGGFNAFSGV